MNLKLYEKNYYYYLIIMEYDYTIVGAGPSGLACAWILGDAIEFDEIMKIYLWNMVQEFI